MASTRGRSVFQPDDSVQSKRSGLCGKVYLVRGDRYQVIFDGDESASYWMSEDELKPVDRLEHELAAPSVKPEDKASESIPMYRPDTYAYAHDAGLFWSRLSGLARELETISGNVGGRSNNAIIGDLETAVSSIKWALANAKVDYSSIF